MNRRDFNKLSTLALAWGSLPAFAQNAMSSPKPLGFAFVGLGTISDIFMRACAITPTAKIAALVTGHPDTKGVKYSGMYNVPKTSIYTYETFDRIADNKDIEAVYIGLPNGMHCEFTIRAAKAGKHVLCEKPMAISSAECRQMIDACRKANVKLMIAYRIQYEQLWNQAIAMIKAGAIGPVQSFQAGFYNQQPPGVWRLSRKLGGGGALLDLGIYPLNAIRHIIGEEPQDFTAVVSTRDKSGRFAEVEQSLEWTMKFPSGIVASCGCSYGERGPGFFLINGETGYLQFDPAFNYDGLRLGGEMVSGVIDEQSHNRQPYMFANEAAHFADCVRSDKEPLSGGEEGLKDMIAIEGIYKAAGTPIA